jgi:hypothetical protein
VGDGEGVTVLVDVSLMVGVREEEGLSDWDPLTERELVGEGVALNDTLGLRDSVGVGLGDDEDDRLTLPVGDPVRVRDTVGVTLDVAVREVEDVREGVVDAEAPLVWEAVGDREVDEVQEGDTEEVAVSDGEPVSDTVAEALGVTLMVGLVVGVKEKDLLGVGDLVMLGVTDGVMEMVGDTLPLSEGALDSLAVLVVEMVGVEDREEYRDGVMEGVTEMVGVPLGVLDGLREMVGVREGDRATEGVKDTESGQGHVNGVRGGRWGSPRVRVKTRSQWITRHIRQKRGQTNPLVPARRKRASVREDMGMGV